MRWYNFETYSRWLLHKTPRFWQSEIRKWFFFAPEGITSYVNIVRHSKIHMCAQYWHIITNYAAILAKTLVVWLRSHETSNKIAHFWEHFSKIFVIFQVYYFSWIPCHLKRQNAKGFHFFDFLWISYVDFKTWSKRREWAFSSSYRFLQNS